MARRNSNAVFFIKLEYLCQVLLAHDGVFHHRNFIAAIQPTPGGFVHAIGSVKPYQIQFGNVIFYQELFKLRIGKGIGYFFRKIVLVDQPDPRIKLGAGQAFNSPPDKKPCNLRLLSNNWRI